MQTDTSPAAQAVYERRLREMTPSERLSVGVSLFHAGDALQRAGLRRRFPDADEDEINFQVAAARYGEALARAAYKRPCR